VYPLLYSTLVKAFSDSFIARCFVCENSSWIVLYVKEVTFLVEMKYCIL